MKFMVLGHAHRFSFRSTISFPLNDAGWWECIRVGVSKKLLPCQNKLNEITRPSFETKEFSNTRVLSPPNEKALHRWSISVFIQQTGTEQLHWIHTGTLGAVIIMMPRNKYDKLYKNIHLDDQLWQSRRKRDIRSRRMGKWKVHSYTLCVLTVLGLCPDCINNFKSIKNSLFWECTVKKRPVISPCGDSLYTSEVINFCRNPVINMQTALLIYLFTFLSVKCYIYNDDRTLDSPDGHMTVCCVTDCFIILKNSVTFLDFGWNVDAKAKKWLA